MSGLRAGKRCFWSQHKILASHEEDGELYPFLRMKSEDDKDQNRPGLFRRGHEKSHEAAVQFYERYSEKSLQKAETRRYIQCFSRKKPRTIFRSTLSRILKNFTVFF
jgi:hypothetical protein